MSIAGHVSRAMLSRYSHVRMEAKRRALDTRSPRGSVRPTRGAGRKPARREQGAMACQSVVVQLTPQDFGQQPQPGIAAMR